jgi:hypothetical protein
VWLGAVEPEEALRQGNRIVGWTAARTAVLELGWALV